MSQAQIHVLTDHDLYWPFDDRSLPTVSIGLTKYPRTVTVDPFPCYGHDRALVSDELERVQNIMPLPAAFRPVIWIMNHERFDRTNAWTQYDEDYDAPDPGQDKPRPWIPSIAFQGKRIPPHPAMTRHLVSHEYGHVIERFIAFRRGHQLHHDTVIEEYAKTRGMDYRPRHSSGRDGGKYWGTAPAEIFADDFRILVADREQEYWPHAGVERPETVPAIREWWAAIQAEWAAIVQGNQAEAPA